jgi:hypothetical protein
VGVEVTSLANAYDQIAEGFAAAALALREGATTPPDAPGAPSFDDLPFDEVYPEAETFGAGQEHAAYGSAAVCPKHGSEYRKGKFGLYCPSTSDDPKWRNDRGYCQITPKSAAAWLRQKAGATA